MKRTKTLTASLENYIKAIYNIMKTKPAARVKDVAASLGIGASSVSEALKNLAEKGMVNYEPYGFITLTDEGNKIAQELAQRHNIIKNFFENVLVLPSELAEESSKEIEHRMAEEVLEKFIMFLEFMSSCSCKEPKWMKSFKEFSSNNGRLSDKCTRCIEAKKNNPKLSNSQCCGMS
ncbi:MAG: metal-dependent transcriptional regulator [bacterium]